MADVPDDLSAPKRVGNGFVLSGVYSQPDGSVQLYYSDGLLGLSVFEREGELDWGALPAGGRTTELDGRRSRVYTTAAGTAVVWGDDDVTYTCVTDAPLDEVAAVAADLVTRRTRGVLEDVGRFVTAPFSWGYGRRGCAETARGARRRRAPGELAGADAGAAGSQDAPTLSLRRAAPDPVLDPVLQRVLEAFGLHRATGAHLAGVLDAHTVGREEERRITAAAVSIEHPHVLGVVIRKRVVIHLVSATVGDAGWFPELLSVWSQVWLEL